MEKKWAGARRELVKNQIYNQDNRNLDKKEFKSSQYQAAKTIQGWFRNREQKKMKEILITATKNKTPDEIDKMIQVQQQKKQQA